MKLPLGDRRASLLTLGFGCFSSITTSRLPMSRGKRHIDADIQRVQAM